MLFLFYPKQRNYDLSVNFLRSRKMELFKN